MAIKTYGAVRLNNKNEWEIYKAQPHVCIKLKAVFTRIHTTSVVPFTFDNSPETCNDLLWFTERYPMDISLDDTLALCKGKENYINLLHEREQILIPDYTPTEVKLKDTHQARHYQLVSADFHLLVKRFLLGDDLGLGKTLSAIITFLNPAARPGIVVVQTHMPTQWDKEGIQKFTNLTTHIINKTKPYTLPPADVYIIKYSCLAGWSDFFTTGYFKSAVFDEVQELRLCNSNKYGGGTNLSNNVDYCIGMSATPIYNFGDEIFNVLDLINPGCLGKRWDFLREWALHRGGDKYLIKDPIALGTYLRDNHLFLRRTRQEVGRELPPINKLIFPVEYDEDEVKDFETLSKQLAITVMQGSFTESGQAARELNMRARQITGVSKARHVAAFVKILLENNQPVLLAGWHREVYEIWEEEFKDYKPVFYTGSETPKQKEEAKRAFIAGETNLFIISLRSGIGLDGLQHRCQDVVIGELDWSPKVHDQLIGRVDRDGSLGQVNAYFLVSEYGSDPVIVDLLALKSSQSHGIINPLLAVPEQFSDESRIKRLAEAFLKKK